MGHPFSKCNPRVTTDGPRNFEQQSSDDAIPELAPPLQTFTPRQRDYYGGFNEDQLFYMTDHQGHQD
ncbi:hypothetical protein TNCV_2706711 [Trichonephila clavipes]|nr:hypothetical protein TNCV_2706711 [Trichonephila clavipes]